MQQVQDFVDSNPLNVIVKDMLHKYEGQTEEVQNLPNRHIIGSIEINTGMVVISGDFAFYFRKWRYPTAIPCDNAQLMQHI